ncbi:MAG: nicotinate (nicotinamide) nucleotide adenylyltransferase [Thermoanaerobaculia bacterium]
MKLGIFGGSFDPIHSGHVLPVRRAKEVVGLDRVIYLPTARPPHKPGRQFARSQRRFAMVEMALLDEPDLEVSAWELTPGRPAFTVDTIERLQKRDPGVDLHLIIGADSFKQLPTWRRWQDITRLASLAVLTRPEWDYRTVERSVPDEMRDLVRDGRVTFVKNDPVEISSTELRHLFRTGGEIPPGAMPERVIKYIRKYSLYR